MKRQLYKSKFDEYRNRYGEGKCGYCGKSLPNRKRRYWCSDECVNKLWAESGNWAVLREQCFKRDDYKCVKCGSDGGDFRHFEADHIKPVELFPELQLELSNLQTLCIKCHKVKTRADIKLISRQRRGIWKGQTKIPDVFVVQEKLDGFSRVFDEQKASRNPESLKR